MTKPASKPRRTRVQQTVDALLDYGANGARNRLQSKFKLSDHDWLDLVREAIVRLEQLDIADPTARKSIIIARLDKISETACDRDKIAALRELNKMIPGCLAPVRAINANVEIEGPNLTTLSERALGSPEALRLLQAADTLLLTNCPPATRQGPSQGSR